VEGQHDDLEGRLVDGAQQHLVRGIARAGLGDGEVAQLALLLLAQQGGDELGDGVVVLRGRQAVQVEDVDVVGAEAAQRGSRLATMASADLGAPAAVTWILVEMTTLSRGRPLMASPTISSVP
jgi:hypothetical protein